MDTKTTKGPSRQARVDSWKAIARYLGRSSRTVQRWQAEYGLPVHRLGGSRSSVFAYEEELDAWLRSRDQSSSGSSSESSTLVTLHGAFLPARQVGPSQSDETFDSLFIADSDKVRAARLVTFGYKMWANLSNDNLNTIARLFREATYADPTNAEAFAGLSHSLIAGSVAGNLRTPEAYISAKAAVEQALELGPESPVVTCAVAWVKMIWERDWLGARRGFDQCLTQQFPSMRAIVGRAMLHIAEGCPKEACSMLREIARRRALSAIAMALYCWSEYLAGEYADALALVEQARASGQAGFILDTVEALLCLHLDEPDAAIARIDTIAADSPHSDLLHGTLGYAYGLRGEVRKAGRTLDALMHQAAHGMSPDPYAVALVLTALNEKHGAVQWLEQSYQDGSLWSLGFSSDPLLAPLREEPSYQMFLGRTGYPASSHHGQIQKGSTIISMTELKASGA